MGVIFIDRRQEQPEDKFGTDRQRFLDRYREIVKKAVSDKVAEGSIKDFESEGVLIPIPKKTLSEPYIHHGEGGRSGKVFPGLMKYEVGDEIPKPEGGGGKGGPGDPSDDGDSEDDFIWLSPDELLSILFEGRRLPDMTKFKAPDVKIVDREHAGYTKKGPAHKLDMDITNRKRAADALILNKLGEKRVIENLSEQYNIYAGYQGTLPQIELTGLSRNERKDAIVQAAQRLTPLFADAAALEGRDDAVPLLNEAVQILKSNLGEKIEKDSDKERLSVLESRLDDQLKSRKNAGRFRPDNLTYKYDDDKPKPAAKAVMICLMDVSASMDQERKNTAKSFFWLMNKFLTTKYDNVDIVFVAHTTEAEEVDEETFFYGRQSGGTIVSSGLAKAKEIIAERYPPSTWNIYAVQASDGENYPNDNVQVERYLRELLPIMQSYYYVQVADPYFGADMMPLYKAIAEEFKGTLYTAKVDNPADSMDAFKYFFPNNGGAAPTPSFTP